MLNSINRIALIAVLLVSISCGASNGRRTASLTASTLVTSCALPNGTQDNSLQGHWLTTDLPLKLSFNADSSWSSNEIGFMTAAADTWNTFYTSSKGGNVFNYGGATPNTSTLNQSRPDCAQVATADGTVIYKRGTWTAGSSVIALTSYCSRTVTESPIRIIYNAIIEMNYQHFYAQSTGRFPDMESIALHEFGHLLGLGHSCGPLNDGSTNIDCPQGDDPDSLRATVMFPDWTFAGNGAGEEKRTLTENDQGRANCLY